MQKEKVVDDKPQREREDKLEKSSENDGDGGEREERVKKKKDGGFRRDEGS